MQLLGLQEAIEIIVEKDPRYRRDAYFFLKEALDFTMKRRHKNRKGDQTTHVTAGELVQGFCDRALQEFGPMTLTLLNYWGIYDSADIGEMVFHLIEVGILGKAEKDTRDSFEKLVDFHETFVVPFEPLATPSQTLNPV